MTEEERLRIETLNEYLTDSIKEELFKNGSVPSTIKFVSDPSRNQARIQDKMKELEERLKELKEQLNPQPKKEDLLEKISRLKSKYK